MSLRPALAREWPSRRSPSHRLGANHTGAGVKPWRRLIAGGSASALGPQDPRRFRSSCGGPTDVVVDRVASASAPLPSPHRVRSPRDAAPLRPLVYPCSRTGVGNGPSVTALTPILSFVKRQMPLAAEDFTF